MLIPCHVEGDQGWRGGIASCCSAIAPATAKYLLRIDPPARLQSFHFHVPNTQDGDAALHAAVRCNDAAMCSLLLRHGTATDLPNEVSGETCGPIRSLDPILRFDPSI